MIDTDSLTCPPFVDRPNRFTLPGMACSLNREQRDLVKTIESEMKKARKLILDPKSSSKIASEGRKQIQLCETALSDLGKAEELIRAAASALYYAEFAKFKTQLIEDGRAQ